MHRPGRATEPPPGRRFFDGGEDGRRVGFGEELLLWNENETEIENAPGETFVRSAGRRGAEARILQGSECRWNYGA